MFVYCECCVFSGRGLCVGLITPPEESYRERMCAVSVIAKPPGRRPRPRIESKRHKKKGNISS